MGTRFFERFFPPPAFMQMRATGLDISDNFLRFVELSPTPKGVVVSAFGETMIPEGVIVSGNIRNVGELSRTLSVFSKKFKSGFVNISLPEEYSYVATLQLPVTKKRELAGSVELQIEDNIPLSAYDAVFDYEEMERTENGGTEVVLAAFPRSIAELYLTALSGADLKPLAFETEAHAIARAVVPHGDKGVFMLMNIGSGSTKLSIVAHGSVRFTSTVRLGGVAFTQAIEKIFSVGKEEAEKMKKERGVRRDHPDLFLRFASMISIFRDEIYKHQAFWKSHGSEYGTAGGGDIEKIFVCGEGADIPGFTEYLSQGLRIPVEYANTMTNMHSFSDHIPSMQFRDSMRYATAIGLALHYSLRV